MFQVRLHGRGGQGMVTGTELLAAAALSEGQHAQAFASSGSERMGAPVMSFVPSGQQSAGFSAAGYMLVNFTHDFEELGLAEYVTGFHRDRRLGRAGLVAGADAPAPPDAGRRECSAGSPR